MEEESNSNFAHFGEPRDLRMKLFHRWHVTYRISKKCTGKFEIATYFSYVYN